MLSPGVPRALTALAGAIAQGRLVGEVELASWFTRTPLVGITGTNGKSTTTALVAHMLECAGRRVFAGGNLGRPLSELPLTEPVDVAVVELSSYQLESVCEAHFRVGCWLNLTPDHLDRYASVEAYAAAKRRILERRSINGTAVLNADDPIVRDVGRRIGGQVRWFSNHDRDERASTMGTFMADETQARRRDSRGEEVYTIDGPALLGRHNKSNACAAIECARFLDASPAAVQEGLSTFPGLPHRLEKVGTIGSTAFFNDSKATNVDAAETAVRSVPSPILLIVGGVDKGGSWRPLVESAKGKVAAVLAIGAAAPLAQSAFEAAGIPVQIVGTLERAVESAAGRLSTGIRTVLSFWRRRARPSTSSPTTGLGATRFAPRFEATDRGGRAMKPSSRIDTDAPDRDADPRRRDLDTLTRSIDPWMTAVMAVVLLALGVVLVYSASAVRADPGRRSTKRRCSCTTWSRWWSVSFALLVVLRLKVDAWGRWAYPLLGVDLRPADRGVGTRALVAGAPTVRSGGSRLGPVGLSASRARQAVGGPVSRPLAGQKAGEGDHLLHRFRAARVGDRRHGDAHSRSSPTSAPARSSSRMLGD